MKALVLGVVHMKGTKKETGKAYDFYQVNIASPMEAVATPTMEKTGTGMEMQQLPLNPLAFPKFCNGIVYPIELDLVTDIVARFGRMQPEVIDFKKLA